MGKMGRARFWRAAAMGLCLSAVAAALAAGMSEGPTLEELKGRVGKAGISDRPALCIQVAELQLGAAQRFYEAGDSEQAKTALTDVVAFSELARDYAVQSRKHQKQSEIAVRGMVRKLMNLKHTVIHEDQEPVQTAVDGLQRVRDDLLSAMFSKGNKK